MMLSVDVLKVPIEGAVEVVSLIFGKDGMLYGGVTGDKGHLLFRYDPDTGKITDLGDKIISGNIIYDEMGNPVKQKIHKALVVSPDGKIYGGTGQNIGIPSPHYRTEDDEGGHVFIYNPLTDKSSDLGIPVAHEWIINLTCDHEGENIYGMTYPLNHVFRCDLKKGNIRIIGQLHGGTYGDSGCSHEIICDLEGNVYGSYSIGYLFKYDVKKDKLIETNIKIPGGDYRIDSLAMNEDGIIYGGTWESGHLFSFNSQKEEIRDIGQPNKGPRLPAIAIKDGILYGAAGGGDTYNTRRSFLFLYDIRNDKLQEVGDIICKSKGIQGQRMHKMAISNDTTIYMGETGTEVLKHTNKKIEEKYIELGTHPYLFMAKYQ